MGINIDSFHQTLCYTASGPIAEIQQGLMELAHTDLDAEAKIQQYGRWQSFSAVILVFLVFLTFLFPILIILAVIFVILFIRLGKKLAYYRRLDIPNHRYRIFGYILNPLAVDVKPQHPVSVTMSFTAPDHQEKFLAQKPYPSRSDWTIQVYQDPWLKLRGRFQDGTQFFLQVIQCHEVRTGKNVNGKNRYKPRYKGFRLNLVLSCDRRRYGLLERLENPTGSVKLPDGVECKALSIVPQSDRLKVRLKVKVPDTLVPGFKPSSVNASAYYTKREGAAPPEQSEKQLETLLSNTVLGMFLSVYQLMNFAALNHQEAH